VREESAAGCDPRTGAQRRFDCRGRACARRLGGRRFALRSDDQAALDQKVSILNANAAVRIRISVHCDERGSDEYNLALGNRRATAAKQYLVSHGIAADRIETVSYGEERPIATGHDEDSWAQNRRDEFEILSGGDNLRKP
jgi:peptidoglycan-associated lipoprotein